MAKGNGHSQQAPAVNHGPTRRARDPFWDSRVHAIACTARTLFNILPDGLWRWTGKMLGRAAWKLDRKHRLQVVRNMDIAFRDEMTHQQKVDLSLRYFEHLGVGVIEFARMLRITPENVDEIADTSELEKFRDLLSRGKGLLCVPAHHGNWELCGHVVSIKGFPVKVVARPLDNPQVNDMITAVREQYGNEVIYKWKVLWKLKKLLDKGSIISLSIDQNGGDGGIFVPYFNTMASTITSPAELHLATGTPILVATLNRKEDGMRHVLRIWDVIEHPPTGDREADVRTIVTRITLATEKAVRAYPEQWLWVHRRWKTRPPGEVPGVDGLPPLANGAVHS